MKAIAITNSGLEETTSSEIKEILKLDSTIKKSTITFDIKKPIELCELAYKAQSINKVMLLLFDLSIYFFKPEIKSVSATIVSAKKTISSP